MAPLRDLRVHREAEAGRIVSDNTDVYPALHLTDEYTRQREADADFLVRDVGHAIVATLLATARDYSDLLPLDSETFRERLGRVLVEYLADAGYRVTFGGTRR